MSIDWEDANAGPIGAVLIQRFQKLGTAHYWYKNGILFQEQATATRYMEHNPGMKKWAIATMHKVMRIKTDCVDIVVGTRPDNQ